MSSSDTPTSRRSNTPPTLTISAAAETHTIKVGPKEDPHAYVPHTLTANVGDLVVFEFYPRNHSVVQADWRAPCMPADGDYFFSGIKNEFMEVNGQVTGRLPTWNMTVDKDEPIFFYCTATDSCIGNGMVGAINPNATMTWDSQYSAAREAPYMLLPGQSMPAEGETDNPGTGTTPHTTASATSNPSPDTSSHSSSSSSSSLSAGAIAGIVLGAVSFVAILCLMLFILGRNNVYKKWVSSSEDGCGNVNAPLRTARWALSNSVEAGAGSRCGKSECEGGVGELGLTPALGPSSATRTGFGSMDHHPGVPRSAIISTHESGDGQALETGHPSLARASQVLNQSPGPTHAGQKGQPYWIWDQSIQPHPYLPKKGPSELDGEPSR